MAGFMIRFLLCNILLGGIIAILLAAKRLLKNSLSGRMQYNLWFLLPALCAVPFLPFPLTGFPRALSWVFSWICSLRSFPTSPIGTALKESAGNNSAENTAWINDFALSVDGKIPSIVGYILLGIWMTGILVMAALTVKSALRLRALEKSALPLQNREIRRLYRHCLEEMGITKTIPVYSTAYIRSPFTVGLVRPRIYLPIHFISDYAPAECRFILLHELQHCKYGDALVNGMMNLIRIVYWINPMIWYALKEMRDDKEIACDSSVLHMLNERDYEAYGNTLIHFAEKLSCSAFPFASTMGGSKRQIRKRIISIVSYQPPTKIRKIKSICAYFLIACLLSAFAPMLSANAAAESFYHMDTHGNPVSTIDLSAYFHDVQGCFALYDASAQNWQIYNKTTAQKRISPDSTCKIYSALFGLENGLITPTSNTMAWDGQEYPIKEWNTGQNLTTAFRNSVNWYFQSLDQRAGLENLEAFYKEIHYGNHDLSGGVSSYWAESSLKISPIEQVELLHRLYTNQFHYDTENVRAIKDALLLSSTTDCSLYGKTGTGKVNGENRSGWFVGWIEAVDHTYFFALHISADADAAGSRASDIALSILSDMEIWE